jgi:RNA polymerase sigma-70 factor (ECF subfamily)
MRMQEIDNEQKLLKKLIQGDAYSFDEIFERFNEKVYAFSIGILKNKQDAEGVVQEVFYILWKERTKLKVIESLDAWIFAVSFNIIRKHFRRLARERKLLNNLTEAALSNDNSTATEFEYADLLEKAEKIIDKLPQRQKAVYMLSKRDGLSNTEISTKLNITNKTVENHLTRAKAKLKRALVNEQILTLFFFWLFL